MQSSKGKMEVLLYGVQKEIYEGMWRNCLALVSILAHYAWSYFCSIFLNCYNIYIYISNQVCNYVKG